MYVIRLYSHHHFFSQRQIIIGFIIWSKLNWLRVGFVRGQENYFVREIFKGAKFGD